MSIDSIKPAAQSTQRTSGGASVTEYIVPPAMLVVAVAAGLACNMHVGFAPELAAAIGLTLFCIMLLGHVLLRPIDDEEDAERPARNVGSPMAKAVRAVHATSPPVREMPPVRTGTRFRPIVPAAAAVVQPKPPKLPSPVEVIAVQAAEPVGQFDIASLGIDRSGAAGQESPVTDTSRQWTYRPVDLKLPVRVDADTDSDAAGDSAAIGQLRPTIVEEAVHAPTFGPLAMTEQERIEQILKRLASQIRAGAGTADMLATTELAAQDAALTTAVPVLPVEPAPELSGATIEPGTALESAVNTLRSTVEAMRSGWPASSVPMDDAAASPPARQATAAEVRLAAVAEALAAERANVFLQPILALKADSARHFEVSVRLRTRDGQVLERAQVAQHIRGAGLLPLLDAIGVRHSAGFALKLERRGRDGAVFSAIAGESLESADFVSDVAGRQAQGIADRLILTFEQEEIRALGAMQMAALAELNELGFRFAIDRLSHLDMDFEALADTGFAFVKLDADVFARGLVLGGTEVPATDLCGFFRDLGLSVIAGRIEDEAVRRRMLGYGVVFGQGTLFGEPRPVPIGTLDTHEGVAA